jgi:hypothetical protein
MTFAGCSALRELEIPSTVTTIGFGFICECSVLRRLTIPSDYQTTGVSSWREAFRNVLIVERLTLVGRDCRRRSLQTGDAVSVSRRG